MCSLSLDYSSLLDRSEIAFQTRCLMVSICFAAIASTFCRTTSSQACSLLLRHDLRVCAGCLQLPLDEGDEVRRREGVELDPFSNPALLPGLATLEGSEFCVVEFQPGWDGLLPSKGFRPQSEF